jgi:hypothetical protein
MDGGGEAQEGPRLEERAHQWPLAGAAVGGALADHDKDWDHAIWPCSDISSLNEVLGLLLFLHCLVERGIFEIAVELLQISISALA